MQAPEISELLKSFAQKFCGSLAQVLSDTCASTWLVTLAAEPFNALPAAPFGATFRYSFDGNYSGDAFLVLPAEALTRLALRDVVEAGPEAAKSQIAALLTGLQAGLPALAASVDEAGATSLLIETIDNFGPAEEQLLELSVQSDPADPETKISLHICVSQRLLTAFRGASAKPFEFPDAVSADGANLDLVMDVELNVTLRFGQRQLALREVLELTSGSVVELDRQVDEPVELVLDGRVVARGEAVIIDGNYGMRITQLVQQPLL